MGTARDDQQLIRGVEQRLDGVEQRLDGVEQRLDGVDRTVTSMEKDDVALAVVAKVTETELASLRASRHDHGNMLNRHELRLEALNQRVTESLIERFAAFEKDLSELTGVTVTHGDRITQLASDARLQAWKIGAIIGSLLFVATQIANRWHF